MSIANLAPRAGLPLRIVQIVLALVAVAVVMLLLAKADRSTLADRASRVGASVWLAGLAGLLLAHAMRASRLHYEWRARRGQAPWSTCLRIALLHNAAVLALPWRAGELAYAVLLRRAWGVGLGEATASLVWLRVQDAVVLVALTLAWLAPSAWMSGAVLAALAGAALVAPRLARQATANPEPATRWQRARAVLLAHRGGGPAWVCCFGTWTLKLAATAALLAAVAGQTLPVAVGGVLAGEWAAVLPLHTPASIGPYEAAAAAALAWGSPDSATSLATWGVCALVAHAFSVVVALLGAAVVALLPHARAVDAAPTCAAAGGR